MLENVGNGPRPAAASCWLAMTASEEESSPPLSMQPTVSSPSRCRATAASSAALSASAHAASVSGSAGVLASASDQ